MDFIFNELGDYRVILTVNDLGGNFHTSEVVISIVESNPPVISDILFEDEIPLFYAGNAEIHFKVRDENLKRVKIIYFSGGSHIRNSSAEHRGGDDYYFKFSGIENKGMIRFHIWAEDEYLNSHETEEMTIQIIDDPEPSVNLSFPSKVFHNDSSMIFVNVSTEIPVSQTGFSYTGVDGEVTNGHLTGDGLDFLYSIPPQNEEGRISFDVTIEFANGFSIESNDNIINVVLDNEPPVAKILNNDILIYEGSRLTLSANESTDDGSYLNYTWIIKDGLNETVRYGRWVVHTFMERGVYEVALIVTDKHGWNYRDDFTVTVIVDRDDIEEPPDRFILRIGPLLDSNGDYVKGASIRLMVSTLVLMDLTDEFGIVEFNVSSDHLNQTADVIITMEGFHPIEYQTVITPEGTVDAIPGALISLSERDESDDSGGSGGLIAIIIIVVLILLIAAGITGLLIYRRKVELKDNGDTGIDQPVTIQDH
jgi:hypothetical protein